MCSAYHADQTTVARFNCVAHFATYAYAPLFRDVCCNAQVNHVDTQSTHNVAATPPRGTHADSNSNFVYMCVCVRVRVSSSARTQLQPCRNKSAIKSHIRRMLVLDAFVVVVVFCVVW